ncbi:Polypeptide N-acetylgalactosaminyltransferase 10 [Bulinus truncatus]|nr:Polypeptide N-acetylgalactosaminyltransferase 10 [Bulinus truncatus]
MGLLSKRQRQFAVLVCVVYFMSIVVVHHYMVESDNFRKAMNHLKQEVSSSLKNLFSEQSYVTIPIVKNYPNQNGQLSRVTSDSNSDRFSILNNTSLNSMNKQDDSRLATNSVVNSDIERIDWNDYELMARESLRRGPGEQGEGYVKNYTADELKIVNELKERYKYNAYASDQISLERSLKDTRTDVCKKKLFLKNLPQNSVSFVVVFNNERNSTLLRTIHGIVNRSPKHLLREIVMVDDCSTDEELKAPLEEYIAKHFTNVRLFRNNERQGLIRSRIIGADHTSGSFIVFLDAHVEVNVNFLPPLIEPMVLDYRTIVCPMIDNTVDETLEVRGLIYRERGAFDWALVYQRLPVHQEDESVPHNVTSMIGCAIAITRRWWEEIGKFDPGLDIWGGEQFEISFKSWMCGGKVVDAPCSRVAHLFRSLPYVKYLMDNSIDQKNLLRVASVWMDEYKEYFLQRRTGLRNVDPGNLTGQHELRKRLKCKSFDWFMKEVAPDIPQYFPLVEPPLMAWGKIKSNSNQSLCITALEKGFTAVQCNQPSVSAFIYNWRLQVRQYDKCFCNPWVDHLTPWACFLFEDKPTQKFVWDRISGCIINVHTKFCLDYKTDTLQVYMTPCKTSATQSWTFEGYNSTLVDLNWEQNKHLLNLTTAL